jgi:hypothetical protein
MNKAQKNLIQIMKVAEGSQAQAFLHECYKAWEGYDDSNYSYPHWQLRALEKKYGMTVGDIKNLYNIKTVV